MSSNPIQTKQRTQTVQGQKIQVRAIGENAEILLFVGKKYHGKSYLAKNLLIKVKQYVIWDENQEYAKFGANAESISSIIMLWNLKKRKIVYVPKQNTKEEFDEFCRICLMLNNCVVYCEELNSYARSNSVPHHFMILLKKGRHRGIGIWCISRRMIGMDIEVPYNASQIFAFRQKRKGDIDALKDYLDEETADQLKEIPKRYFIHYIDESDTTYVHKPI